MVFCKLSKKPGKGLPFPSSSYGTFSGFAGAAEHVDQLVTDQLLDVGPGGLQVLPGVELLGMVHKELTDGASHGQAQIGVDVDLAHGALGGLAQLPTASGILPPWVLIIFT